MAREILGMDGWGLELAHSLTQEVQIFTMYRSERERGREGERKESIGVQSWQRVIERVSFSSQNQKVEKKLGRQGTLNGGGWTDIIFSGLKGVFVIQGEDPREYGT